MQDLSDHVHEQEVATQKQCPKCQGRRVARSRRRGPCEWLLRAIRLFPFRCDICGHRFMHLTWSGR
jgi:predicted Zn-ribbon and HTH transcriptional regulator